MTRFLGRGKGTSFAFTQIRLLLCWDSLHYHQATMAIRLLPSAPSGPCPPPPPLLRARSISDEVLDNDDLLRLIMSRLGDAQPLLRAGSTCARWRSLSNGNEVWKPVCTTRYHFTGVVDLGTQVSFKDIFKRIETNLKSAPEQVGMGS